MNSTPTKIAQYRHHRLLYVTTSTWSTLIDSTHHGRLELVRQRLPSPFLKTVYRQLVLVFTFDPHVLYIWLSAFDECADLRSGGHLLAAPAP